MEFFGFLHSKTEKTARASKSAPKFAIKQFCIYAICRVFPIMLFRTALLYNGWENTFLIFGGSKEIAILVVTYKSFSTEM